ncbi:hypothetical protein Cgig2_031378 [Carnegiea gigantea]|uniref:Uncharacterized protein n=1 Tax=Carnegiea gigantea TaxID=171969 RepID=A0A9Q1JPF4_9CARY|nr:hypothetical protein Cgig2_031378 [Carnegiea gigantea]
MKYWAIAFGKSANNRKELKLGIRGGKIVSIQNRTINDLSRVASYIGWRMINRLQHNTQMSLAGVTIQCCSSPLDTNVKHVDGYPVRELQKVALNAGKRTPLILVLSVWDFISFTSECTNQTHPPPPPPKKKKGKKATHASIPRAEFPGSKVLVDGTCCIRWSLTNVVSLAIWMHAQTCVLLLNLPSRNHTKEVLISYHGLNQLPITVIFKVNLLYPTRKGGEGGRFKRKDINLPF